MKLENITSQSAELLATIIRNTEITEGIHFPTNEDGELQVGFMKRKKNYMIKKHMHPERRRNIYRTTEVLLVKSGCVVATIFDTENRHVAERELTSGDILIIFTGWHQFVFQEDSELIEVKQGPFIAALDKVYDE